MDTQKGQEISKHHATIMKTEKNGILKWNLIDNNSLNGTFLNKRKINSHILKNGDEIIFGGGTIFTHGDKLESSINSECRYIFFIPEPQIIFSLNINFNIILLPLEKCEECPMCYLPLKKDLILKCNHKFCFKCLRSWTQQCILSRNKPICPICRLEFDPEIIFFGEGIEINNTIQIQTIIPFLRSISILSLKDLTNFSFDKNLNQNDINKFWINYNICKKKPIRLKLLLYFNFLTFHQVLNSSNDQVFNIVKNLNGNINLDFFNLKLEAINLIYFNFVK